jgi:hypothetical protein
VQFVENQVNAAGESWHQVTDANDWDQALAELGGHPLQSALWGDARRNSDGIEDRRLMLCQGGIPVLMARMEMRRLPAVSALVGWMPRGPAGAGLLDKEAVRQLCEAADCHPLFIVTDRWCESSLAPGTANTPQTIWIDLSSGAEAIWQRLDKQWRYGVGKGRRAGIEVEESCAEEDRARFVELNKEIGDRKGFETTITASMLDHLVGTRPDGAVSAHLFVARSNGTFASAALILRCGASVHYIAGGTDRRFAKQRVGEVLHWSIMEWAIKEGARLYDLEGIDRVRNPGTFAFKKKMGGREVALEGKDYYSFSALGSVAAYIDRLRSGRIGRPANERGA